MGAVLLQVGHVLGSDLGGLYKSMPVTTVCCVVGAASISAFPLFNGFVSKSMIMAAMVEQGHTLGWLGLLFASAGVFHHAGIKIPYFAFFAHDSGLRFPEAPRNMLLAMAIAAVLCVLTGSYPALLYGLLPWEVDYAPYTYPHVMVQLQLLVFSALAFAWLNLVGIYPPELHSVNLDADWLYRRLGPRVSLAATQALEAATRVVVRPLRSNASRLRRVVDPNSILARSAETGTAALLVGVLLAGYLLTYYISS
jgi:multicomponent Na+:H+ antiporter subunit D